MVPSLKHLAMLVARKVRIALDKILRFKRTKVVSLIKHFTSPFGLRERMSRPRRCPPHLTDIIQQYTTCVNNLIADNFRLGFV